MTSNTFVDLLCCVQFARSVDVCRSVRCVTKSVFDLTLSSSLFPAHAIAFLAIVAIADVGAQREYHQQQHRQPTIRNTIHRLFWLFLFIGPKTK
jgi:hypothetical protein